MPLSLSVLGLAHHSTAIHAPPSAEAGASAAYRVACGRLRLRARDDVGGCGWAGCPLSSRQGTSFPRRLVKLSPYLARESGPAVASSSSNLVGQGRSQPVPGPSPSERVLPLPARHSSTLLRAQRPTPSSFRRAPTRLGAPPPCARGAHSLFPAPPWPPASERARREPADETRPARCSRLIKPVPQVSH